MATETKICPSCKGKGKFGISGGAGGLASSTCWVCKGAGVVVKA